MERYKKSQNEEKIVTFVHTFKVPARDVKHMMPRQFATVYEYGLVNWHIQISESGGIPFFIRNAGIDGFENRPPVCQVMLHPAGQRERHPPVLKVDFRIRVLAGERDYLNALHYSHPGGFPPRTLLNACYSTPEQSPINSTIASIIGLQGNYEFEVQTSIVYDVSEFLKIKYINRSIGKPMPVDLNFRFNLLMNESTHNFSLRTTRSEEFPCNKEALFVASPFFRKTLSGEMSSYQMDVDNLEAIEVAVTWMLTETYHPPQKMCPELADEIVKLADRIVSRGPNHRQLLGSIERHCLEELIKVTRIQLTLTISFQNSEDLQYVKHMLLVAHNNRLGGLLEASHAVIISYHHTDFRRDMEQNPNPSFNIQTPLVRFSALTRFHENYAKSLYVRCYANKTISQ